MTLQLLSATMLPTLRRVMYQVGYLVQHLNTKNLKTFLVCAFVATCLWLFNALRKEHTETIYYPIQFDFNSEKYMITGKMPTDVPVLVKGSGWQILRKMFHLRIAPIKYELSPEYQMKRPYLLRTELFRETEKVIENVRLEDVLKDTLNLSMDYRYKRVLRIGIDSTKLSLKKDYRVVSPVKVQPALVAVVGPKKMLKSLPNPYLLDMRDVTIREDHFSKTFQIEIHGVPSHLLTQDEQRVHISFDVERFVQKNINVPIVIGSGKNQKTLSLPVNYSVRESQANNVNPKDFVFEADWTEYKKEEGTISVRLRKFPSQVLKDDIFFIKRLKVE